MHDDATTTRPMFAVLFLLSSSARAESAAAELPEREVVILHIDVFVPGNWEFAYGSRAESASTK